MDSTKTSGFDSLLSDYSVFNLTVHATHQIYDVVHVFGTDDEGYDTVQNETITKIIHLSTTGVEIKDNTIVFQEWCGFQATGRLGMFVVYQKLLSART